MKIHFTFADESGWASVDLEAETVQEAAQLVRLGLNMNADSRKLCSIRADDSVKGCIQLSMVSPANKRCYIERRK